MVRSSATLAGRESEDPRGGEDLRGDVDRAVTLLVACRLTELNLRGSDIALGAGRSTVLETVDGPPLAACLNLSISRFSASSSAPPSSSASSSPPPSPPRDVIQPVADVENRFSNAFDGDSTGAEASDDRAGSDEAKRAASEGASESS